MLHLELTAGVSVTAHVHGLLVEGLNLKEVLTVSALHFAWFHQSSFFINLGSSYCNSFDLTCCN